MRDAPRAISVIHDAPHLGRWLIPFLVGLGVLAAIVAGLAVGASAWVIIANVSGLLILMLLGRNRRSARVQAEQAAALLAKAEQLQDEHARVATLDERARIALEIHDVLAHSLGALGVQIQVARAVLTDQNDVPRAVEVLDQAHRMAIDGLAETRRAVHALRGDTLPLPAGLARLSADHQQQHGAPVTFEVSGEPRPLTPDAGLAMRFPRFTGRWRDDKAPEDATTTQELVELFLTARHTPAGS